MIKTLSSALFFLNVSLASIAQQQERIAAGYPIRLGDYPCSTIVTTNNGEITKERYGNKCSYRFIALDTGSTSIFIKGSKSSDTIKLNAFPPPVYVSISGKRKGEISKPFFQVSRGLVARIDLDPAHQVDIKTYTFTIVRNQEIRFKKTSENILFEHDKEILTAINTICKGDIVIFSDVQCELFNKKIVEATELKLTIN